MAKASDNPYPSLLLVEQAATPATPAAGQARLYRGTDNKLYVVSDAGVVTEVGGGGGLVDFAHAKRTAGTVILNNTAWTNIDTALDLPMTAAAGDVIEARMAIRADAAGGPWCVLDFHTMVAGVAVNRVSTDSAASGTAGSHPGWATGLVMTGSPGGYTWFNSSKRYTLVPGDIDAGSVTLRLRGRSGGAVNLAASDPHLYVEATNLGPQL